jgi:DNA polymerase-3 subunit epsilon
MDAREKGSGMSGWAQGPLLSFDSESTGTDPLTARIVTAAAVHVTPDRQTRTVEWILDPGVDVPAEAEAVHGWSRDKILEVVGHEGQAVRREDGDQMEMTTDGALFDMASTVAQAMGREVPLVIHNAPYDLGLLEAELDRFGIDSLASRPAGIRGVVDSMVIEKEYDPFRKTCYRAAGCDHVAGVVNCSGCRGGKGYQCGGCGAPDRKLTSLCQHYQVPLLDAHNAAADAMAAVRLAVRLAYLWPQIARWTLPTLHKYETKWRREQQDSLREFWKKKGDERWREVDGDWPVRRTSTGAAA